MADIAPDRSLLDKTIAAAITDPPTVHADGTKRARALGGQLEHKSVTHVDDRGTVTEMFDTRWGWHPDPINFVYTYTLRPGWAKGWGMHQEHDDRYFLLDGRMQIVCYDVRPGSPTEGEIFHVILSDDNPRIVSIPTFVWHANLNIGSGTVRVVNFPTKPYDHDRPDKLRLPLVNDIIPYKIEGYRGW